MTNLPQSVLDAIAQAAKEGRVTGLGVGPLPGQHAGPTPGGVAATPPESEAAFQQRVIDRLHAAGFRVAHFRKVRVQRADGSTFWETPVAADGKGFLDLEAVRPPRVLKIELKVGRNKPTAEQAAWVRLYEACPGVECYVWWPEDWAEIELVIR